MQLRNKGKRNLFSDFIFQSILEGKIVKKKREQFPLVMELPPKRNIGTNIKMMNP